MQRSKVSKRYLIPALTLVVGGVFLSCRHSESTSEPTMSGGERLPPDSPLRQSTIAIGKHTDAGFDVFCSAVIIGEREHGEKKQYWAATAAHCVQDEGEMQSDLLVGLGDLPASDANNFLPVTSAAVYEDRGRTHGRFGFSYDVAYVAFEAPADKKLSPVPVCADPAIFTPEQAASFLAVGYGRQHPSGKPDPVTKHPREAGERLALAYDVDFYRDTNFERAMVVGRNYENAGILGGDSGGPLYAMLSEGPCLAGIVSWSSEKGMGIDADGEFSSKARHTFLGPYVAWLEKTAPLTTVGQNASAEPWPGDNSLAHPANFTEWCENKNITPEAEAMLTYITGQLSSASDKEKNGNRSPFDSGADGFRPSCDDIFKGLARISLSFETGAYPGKDPLPWVANKDKIALLSLVTSLTDLNLESLGITTDEVEQLAALPELLYLNVADNYLTDLAWLERFPKIKQVSAHDNMIASLDSLPDRELEYLSLANNPLGPKRPCPKQVESCDYGYDPIGTWEEKCEGKASSLADALACFKMAVREFHFESPERGGERVRSAEKMFDELCRSGHEDAACRYRPYVERTLKRLGLAAAR